MGAQADITGCRSAARFGTRPAQPLMNCVVPIPLRHRDDIEMLIGATPRVRASIRSTAKGAGRQLCPNRDGQRHVSGGPDRVATSCRAGEVELETDARAEIRFRSELRRRGHGQGERHGLTLSGERPGVFNHHVVVPDIGPGSIDSVGGIRGGEDSVEGTDAASLEIPLVGQRTTADGARGERHVCAG